MSPRRPLAPESALARIYFFLFVSVGGFAPYAGLFLERRGLGPEQVAWIFTIMPLARVLVLPAWGWAADRAEDPRRVFAAGVLAAAAAPLALLSPSLGFQATTLVFLALAALHSPLPPLADALTLGALRAEPQRFGEVRAAGSAGFLVACLLVGGLYSRGGLPLAPLAITLGVLATLPALARLPPGLDVEAKGPPSLADAGQLLRRPELAALYLVTLLQSTAGVGYMVWFTVHCDRLGLPTWVSGVAWALGVATEIVILRRGPLWLRWLGPRGLLLVGVAAGIPRWYLSAWAVHPGILVALQALHGVTFGAWFLATMDLLAAWVPRALTGTGQGLFYAALSGLGPALGARLLGPVLAAQGSVAMLETMGHLAILTTTVALAAAFSLRDRRAGPRPGEPPPAAEGPPR